MVSRDGCGVRPGGKQAGGQVWFPEVAGQVQPSLDERQRGVLLPLAQQDPGSQVQQLVGKVVELRRGEVSTEVGIDIGGQVVSAVITT